MQVKKGSNFCKKILDESEIKWYINKAVLKNELHYMEYGEVSKWS